MTARDRFTENLKCPVCGLEGVAQLSQADGWSFEKDQSTRVDFCPEGFKPVKRSDGSNIVDFYCLKDNVLA